MCNSYLHVSTKTSSNLASSALPCPESAGKQDSVLGQTASEEGWAALYKSSFNSTPLSEKQRLQKDPGVSKAAQRWGVLPTPTFPSRGRKTEGPKNKLVEKYLLQ